MFFKNTVILNRFNLYTVKYQVLCFTMVVVLKEGLKHNQNQEKCIWS